MNQMPHYYMGYVLTFVKKRGEKRIKSLVLDQQLGLENRSAFVHGQCVCACVCVCVCVCAHMYMCDCILPLHSTITHIQY